MLSGRTVIVVRPGDTWKDRLGNDRDGEPTRTTVENVIVQRGASADLEASRPDGVTVAFTLHFPKAFADSLRGCSVELPEPWEGTYRVIGDPQFYDPNMTPGDWWNPVEVERSDG